MYTYIYTRTPRTHVYVYVSFYVCIYIYIKERKRERERERERERKSLREPSRIKVSPLRTTRAYYGLLGLIRMYVCLSWEPLLSLRSFAVQDCDTLFEFMGWDVPRKTAKRWNMDIG